MNPAVFIAAGLCAPLAACAPSANKQPGDSGAPVTAQVSEAFAWPKALNAFGDGYPKAGDPCRRLGESALTVDFLDDSAVLVGCPGPASDPAATALVAGSGGRIVGAAEGVTFISIPHGGANAGMTPARPAARSSS